MDKIKEELLKMSGLVEESVDQATKSVVGRNSELAREVLRNDFRINELENLIDQRCIRLLATHQPVAVDLRFLTAALRICSELERIGDQSVNLAQRALVMNELEPIDDTPLKILKMSEIAKEMTRKCLDSFVQQDTALAYDVCCQDDELDDLNHAVLEEMITWMMEERRIIRRGVELVLAARHLERIGDLATNVAESVVFMVEGTIIRHHAAEPCRPNR